MVSIIKKIMREKGLEVKPKKEDANNNKYDDRGNIIYCKDSDNHECWYEYDDRNNQTYYKTSGGYESWNEYDDDDNMIHFKDSTEHESWMDYNVQGNVIEEILILKKGKYYLNDKLLTKIKREEN